MPLSLTCDCGARFEVEDALAGQTVACPECQQPIKAPAVQRPTVRTSGFALASFLLAVVGAFTVVGTAAAVVLGAVAVVQILRDRDRVAGLGFAVAGVVLGLAFTTLTLWSLSTGELFGLGATVRRAQMADQLDPADPKAPLEIKEDGFSLVRPTARWLRAKKDFQYLLVQPLLRKEALLLLVEPDLYAFVDVEAEANDRVGFIDDFILNRLRSIPGRAPADKDVGKDKGGLRFPGHNGDDDDPADPPRVKEPRLLTSKTLPAESGVRQANELSAEVSIDGKAWTLLIRTFQTTGGKIFIVRGFAESSHFARVKDELVKALDSFKIAPGS